MFCANDLLALGVLQTAFDAGVRVPMTWLLWAITTSIPQGPASSRLMSVRHPVREIGSLAAELKLQEVEPPAPGPGAPAHPHRSRAELVVRRSNMPR
ncbi:substrate-binding domain-containing protein [Streptomyces sp. NPDC047841]|uniref:substrate-binding domain-containing protein n=1 Tax=Streptomyces sp. NPDC047841 TaxID=3154708 RepID=UPI003453537F